MIKIFKKVLITYIIVTIATIGTLFAMDFGDVNIKGDLNVEGNTTISTVTFSDVLDMNNNSILNIDWANSDDGSGSLLDADYLDGYDYQHFLDTPTYDSDGNNIADVKLNEIENPNSDTSFIMNASTIGFIFTNAIGGMKWEANGSATGHILDLQENSNSTGLSIQNDQLLHMEANSPDFLPGHFINNSTEAYALGLDGKLTTLRDDQITIDTNTVVSGNLNVEKQTTLSTTTVTDIETHYDDIIFASQENYIKSNVGCFVYFSTNTPIPNQTNTKLKFNATKWDLDTTFNTTTNEFVAPVDGYYHVSPNIVMDNALDKYTLELKLYINGSEPNPTCRRYTHVAAKDDVAISHNSIIKLNKGDTISFYMFQDSGTTLDVLSAHSGMQIFLISK